MYKRQEEDFAAHRIAAQVVNDMEDLVEEEHLKLRNTWVDWETVSYTHLLVVPQLLPIVHQSRKCYRSY